MNKIKQSILAIVIGLVLSAGVSYAAGIWKDPACGPTGCNTDAPINTGTDDQIKAGALRIGNPTLGFVVDGASSFKGQSQFLNPVIFKGQITIDKSPTYGAVLTSDAGGNTSWKMPKIVTKIKEVIDADGYNNSDRPWGGSGTTNNWNKGDVNCDSGYTRTGCTATCQGVSTDFDLVPVGSDDSEGGGCKLGANDKCYGSNPIIRIRTICSKIKAQ